MKLPFVKMHGAGNDFVVLNCIERPFDLTVEQIQKLGHRKFGVGFDQLLVLLPSSQADFRMDIYNSDGSHVEMCGNGIRCFAKYVSDEGLSKKDELTVETLAGIMKPVLLSKHPQNSKDTTWVRVDMGTPILEGRDIPINADGLFIKKKIKPKAKELDGKEYEVSCVSMGNPHCVIYVPNAENYPVTVEGPHLENDPFFPNRINVEFIQVLNRKTLRMRVWERGAGETMACGTGACAAAVASILNNLTERQVTLKLNGGDLEIFWDETDDHVYMTGPATTVFKGELRIS